MNLFNQVDQKIFIRIKKSSKKILLIFDPDQKKSHGFLIRIKKNHTNFWSGSKKITTIFDPDQKKSRRFLIRIKKNRNDFWSGSKKITPIFDPDQKKSHRFLIRIKKNLIDFWSGSWHFHDPDHRIMNFWIKSEKKNDPWSPSREDLDGSPPWCQPQGRA